MKERPILFSAPMVRAILDGRKTQTRRIVKPQPTLSENAGLGWRGVVYGITTDRQPYLREFLKRCPYGVPGDRLWVRETWYCDDFTERDFEAARIGRVTPVTDAEIIADWQKALYYRADATQTGTCCELIPECMCDEYRTKTGRRQSPWKPGIHMPRWACRIELEVTGVRVERAQDISKDDAIAEGAKRFDDIPKSSFGGDARWSMESPENCGQCLGSPQTAFGNLWIKINGQESWNANPWVWVIEFKRIEAQERAA